MTYEQIDTLKHHLITKGVQFTIKINDPIGAHLFICKLSCNKRYNVPYCFASWIKWRGYFTMVIHYFLQYYINRYIINTWIFLL